MPEFLIGVKNFMVLNIQINIKKKKMFKKNNHFEFSGVLYR